MIGGGDARGGRVVGGSGIVVEIGKSGGNSIRWQEKMTRTKKN